MTMWMFVSICGVAAGLAVTAVAQEGEMPQMTPERQAEMEAYVKAGALGPQHELMAEQVGTYYVTIKSWMDPEAPPVESKGVAIRTLHIGGRVTHEEFQNSVPFEGWRSLCRDGLPRTPVVTYRRTDRGMRDHFGLRESNPTRC